MGGEVVIQRLLDASRHLVFEAWTEPAQLMRWRAPNGCISPSCTVDLRVGGIFRFRMQSPDGRDIWACSVYLEIAEPERIVYTDSFADAACNLVPPSHYGMSKSYPAETLVTVTFAEHAGKTAITLRHAASATIDESDGLEQGWTEMFDRLAELLPTMA